VGGGGRRRGYFGAINAELLKLNVVASFFILTFKRRKKKNMSEIGPEFTIY
jgi:hypothetical protein